MSVTVNGIIPRNVIAIHETTIAAVSGFIEQVGNMIKGIPKHNYYPSTPS